MIPVMGLVFTYCSTLEALRSVGDLVLHDWTPGTEASSALGWDIRVTGIHQWSLNLLDLLDLWLLYFSRLQMSLLMDREGGLGVKPAGYFLSIDEHLMDLWPCGTESTPVFPEFIEHFLQQNLRGICLTNIGNSVYKPFQSLTMVWAVCESWLV